MLAVPEENPTPDKADADQKKDRSADKYPPSEVRGAIVNIANFCEVVVYCVFHKQKAIGGRNTGDNQHHYSD